MFVALAEEGWSEGEAVDAVTERYLAHLDARVDTVVLGCTHFPLLAGADHPATRARAPRGGFGGDHGARHGRDARRARSLAAHATRAGTVRLLATDSPERFARVGARFLGLIDRGTDGRSNRPVVTFHNDGYTWRPARRRRTGTQGNGIDARKIRSCT